MLEVKGLSRVYPEFHLEADFAVGRGEFFSLLGPSGCGKTTLLRLIAGLEKPDTGKVRLNKQDMTEMPPSERRIGLVFQDYALFPHMNVIENVGYGLAVQKRPDHEREWRVNELLGLFEIDHLAKRNVGALSGGERQRVALARALAPEPYVILMDEPFSALDYGLRRRLREELRTLQKKVGFTAVFVTHHQEDALALSDRLAVMSDGRILQCGSPETVYNKPDRKEVASFLGEASFLPGTVSGFYAGRIQLDLLGRRLEVSDRGEAFFVGQTIWVMLRPEDWVWGLPGGIPVKVMGCEYLGYSAICRVEGDHWNGRVMLAKGIPLPDEGEIVTLGIEPELALILPR